MSAARLLLVKAIMAYIAARGSTRLRDMDTQLLSFAIQAKRRRKRALLQLAEDLELKQSFLAKRKKAKRQRRSITRARDKW